MFKSVFAKYLMAFMALLLASLGLLLILVNSVVGNYSHRMERDHLLSVAQAAAEEMEDLYAAANTTDFAAFVYAQTTDEGSTLARVLRAHAAHFEDMTVYVTDGRGGFLFSCDRAGNIPPPGTTILGEDYFAALTEVERPQEGVQVLPGAGLGGETETVPSGAYPQIDPLLLGLEVPDARNLMAYATPVLSVGGEAVGHVLVVSTAVGGDQLLSTTLRSVAVAGLWILLAALIAIYFVTERVIAPLKDMSRAAKRLMVGEFDVRVPVRGRDEVAELAVAFNQMAGALGNLNTMRNAFVANVSHDLRTPMTTIAGFIDGILDGVIPPEEHMHYLRVVTDEVRRLSRLVTALLDLSRLQAGDRKFDMQPFDVCEMGRQILISFEQKIEARDLQVEFDCEEERMYALADRDAIHQILYNICDNAIKFAYDGGRLRMRFETRAWEGHRGQKIYVSVLNDGRGIPPEDMPFVFERFYKADKSRSLDKSGVGLGMFIAKTIIDAHHETITVSGEYGHTCEFTFTLAPADPPAGKGRTGSPQGGTTHE